MELVTEIREQLRAASNPERAPKQQAYMKSELPFWGLPVPEARKITREAARGSEAVTLRVAANKLWDEATHREEWYAAMTLLSLRPNRGAPELVPLIEHMVRTGRWWDVTDELARRLGELLRSRPQETTALMKQWAYDEELWIRRIAIIAQLGRKDSTDTDLLAEVIIPNLADSDFFIRKAIGWALRDYAKVNPEWVRDFTETHSLSPLSRKEALKHL